MTTVRFEIPGDIAGIRLVNELAFGSPAESELVESLRARGMATHSLVAKEDNRFSAIVKAVVTSNQFQMRVKTDEKATSTN